MVDISEMLSPMVTDVLRGMIQHGTKASADNKELEALRVVVREQLRREMRYNAELLNEQKIDPASRILHLEKEALEFVFAQGIPLSILLDRAVPEHIIRTAAGSSQRHTMHLMLLTTEAELMERLTHRMKIATMRAKYDIGLGDISYLRKLIVAAHLTFAQD